jgi:glycosyltransferase involved in cell wall biosynthesis
VRVLITVPSLAREFGGPAAKARDLAAALRRIGHEVEVVGCGAAEEAIGLGRVGGLHGTPVPTDVRPIISAVRRSDIVHVLGYRDPVGTTAALASRRAGIPYVIEPVGMHRRRLRSFRIKAAYEASFGRAVMGRAARVIATSRLEAGELTSDGVDPDRVRLRPNGVVVAEFLPLPPRDRLRGRRGMSSPGPLVLALGRIAFKKGLHYLAEALASLPHVRALVAGPEDGDGGLAALLEARGRLHLEDRLIVETGWRGGRRKAQAFAEADCFCLPSASENFGTAALEAAAVGLPVALTDCCGGSEWLDPKASRVVPYADPDALAVALQEVLEGEEARKAAARAAPRLRRELDWNALAVRQVDIYDEILERSPALAGLEP